METSNRVKKRMFVLAILVVVSAPILQFLWPEITREQVLRTAHRTFGMKYYLDNEILHKNGDIDLAVIGSSHVYGGLNLPIVKEFIEERQGRAIVATHLPINDKGYEIQYLAIQVLLKRRNVKLLLVETDINLQTKINQSSCFLMFFPHWANVFGDLDLKMKKDFYLCSIISTPRLMLNYIDPKSRSIAQPDAGIEQLLGGKLFGGDIPENWRPRLREIAWDQRKSDVLHDPKSVNLSYRVKHHSNFNAFFAIKIMELAKRYNTQVAILRFPYRHFRSRKIPMLAGIRSYLTENSIPVIGAGRNVFDKVSFVPFQKMFDDHVHFNQIGNYYMSNLVAEPISDLLEKTEGR